MKKINRKTYDFSLIRLTIEYNNVAVMRRVVPNTRPAIETNAKFVTTLPNSENRCNVHPPKINPITNNNNPGIP